MSDESPCDGECPSGQGARRSQAEKDEFGCQLVRMEVEGGGIHTRIDAASTAPSRAVSVSRWKSMKMVPNPIKHGTYT